MLNVGELIVAIDFLKNNQTLTDVDNRGVKVQTKVLPSIRDVTYARLLEARIRLASHRKGTSL